jgi:hypothetical protein
MMTLVMKLKQQQQKRLEQFVVEEEQKNVHMSFLCAPSLLRLTS